MRPHSVKQFSAKYPAFSEASLRNLIFKAERRHSTKGELEGNGLIEVGAIVRIGRRVLIDEERFFEWVLQRNGLAAKKASTPTTSHPLPNATVAA